MDIQAMVDGMYARWQRERAASQMTLGKMIEALAAMDPEKKMSGLHAPHSYRGYYRDLAFEASHTDDTAGTLLALCRSCMGETFEGYKGGDFDMGAQTPVWVANYGDTGVKIVGFDDNGRVLTQEDE
jgi:hypothetical protein